ncbi:hypothetical protein ACF1BS_28190 [Streptomyces sp. NPDC014748]|uniref:hypothetical protein n=1 Tax=Streptomyces sp. NPDC014748 TaxID=3364905 RepID=UPI0036F5B8C4
MPTLSSTALDPKGKAAPAGFYSLGATEVTVPAHGKHPSPSPSTPAAAPRTARTRRT